MTDAVTPFTDPQAVARYAEGPPRLVPGLAGLHRMAMILMSEGTPAHARVLVFGAGGGMELRAFAEARPGWRLDGVDPSAPMLALALATLGPLAHRARLVEGTIEAAPEGPYDAAACLLTLHFLPRDERLRTLAALRRRLRPGAPFVAAHHSIPAGEERALWLGRYAAFAEASGVEPTQARGAASAIMERLPVLTPEEDEALMREAGFAGVALFYAGLTFRGWVARA